LETQRVSSQCARRVVVSRSGQRTDWLTRVASSCFTQSRATCFLRYQSRAPLSSWDSRRVSSG